MIVARMCPVFFSLLKLQHEGLSAELGPCTEKSATEVPRLSSARRRKLLRGREGRGGFRKGGLREGGREGGREGSGRCL